MLEKRKNHRIVLKDGRSLAVTLAQSELYKQEVNLKKFSDFITLSDTDT